MSLHFDITGDNANFLRKLDEARNGVRSTSKQIEESGVSIEQMFGRLAKGAAAFGAGITAKEIVSNIVRVRGEFQQLEVAFKTMLGSEEQAITLMGQLVNTAAKTPFDLQGVANGAKQLLAYGASAEDVNGTLVRLGDIAAGLSIPLGDLVYLYGTTMTQGRLFTQDLRQFQGRGIPLADELAKQFGVAKDKVGELVTAGKVGFPEVQKAIEAMTNDGGKFGGLMEAQSKTITGQISNIEDSIATMYNNIGKQSEGFINDALSGVSYLIENYEAIGKIVLELAAVYGTYKAAIIVLSAVEKARYTATLAMGATEKTLTTWQTIRFASTEKLTSAQKALNAAMLKNPYVLIATAIAGLTYGIYKLVTAETAAEKATRKHNEEQERFNNNLDERKQKIDELIRTIQDETETEYAKAKAYDELQRLSPALTNAYTLEQLAIASLTETTKKLNEERDKNNYDNIISNVKKYTETLSKSRAEAEKLREEAKNENDPEKAANLNNLAFGHEFSATNAEHALKQWKKDLNELNRLREKAKEDNKTIEIKLFEAQNSRVQIVQEFAAAKFTLEEEQRKIKESGFGVIPIDVQIRFDNAKAQLANINKTIASFTQSNSTQTYKEAYATAKKEWKAAQKALEESKKKSKSDYDKAKKDLDDKEKVYKNLGGATGSSLTKQENQAEKLRKEQEKLKDIQIKNAKDLERTLKDLYFDVEQARIDALEEGGEKTIEQMNLNHEKEIETQERQREDFLQRKRDAAKAEFEANPRNKKKSFDASGITLDDTENSMFDKKNKDILDRQAKERQAHYDAEIQSMNNYLVEYGTYEQKRQAIIDQGEEKKKGKNDWEQKSINEETKKLLAGVDDEVQKKTSIITQLFSDMSKRTVTDMRLIASEAQKMLDYINDGEFKTDKNGKGLFGLTKEQFDILSKSPEKLESIKNEIANVETEADKAETSLNKISNGLKSLFSTGNDTKKLKKALAEIEEGMNDIMRAAGFLSDSLASLGDAFGNDTLSGIAEGINVAMDAMSSTMEGANAGAAFGPWGAAAGAAIGMVSSLASSIAKIHDSKNEKRIQRLQEQIEVLEKSYDNLGDSIEKAYSSDASKLIEQQNTLLEQKKALIQSQIAEEKDKKDTDKGKIKEWENQIEDINKLIGENKEKAIDAIFGEDLKSAIDNFAQAYANAWTSNENKAEAAKDVVRNMMRQMVTESIKAAIESSKKMEEIRNKLKEFYADNVLSGWEQDYIYKMGNDLQKELDRKFGWADGLMKDEKSTSQNSTKGMSQTMSEDTGNELNGRFTAFQDSNESIKNSMLSMLASMNLISVSVNSNGAILIEIKNLMVSSNSYLEDISKYTKLLIDCKKELESIKNNTKSL